MGSEPEVIGVKDNEESAMALPSFLKAAGILPRVAFGRCRLGARTMDCRARCWRTVRAGFSVARKPGMIT